ncbi:MAG: choice-of-anchor J domain-containing protein, partial [Bacteroidales bacterium]|nr:choice-of-anchor J domain-containing protein [Bacteroidales bacterium]
MKRIMFFLMAIIFAVETWSQITTFPFTEGFEGTSVPPTDWTMYYNDGQTSGTCSNIMSYVNSPVHSGSQSFRFSSYSGTGCLTQQYLITPELNFGGTDKLLKFYYAIYSGDYGDKFRVGVSSTDSLYTSFTWDEWISSPSTGSFSESNVVEKILGDTVKYVAIMYEGTYLYYVYIDDFSIDEIPTCMKPINVTASNITQTSADISWTPADVGDVGWWLYLKESTALTYDDSVYVTSSDIPFSLENYFTLTANTSYNLVMKTDCNDGTLSDVSTPVCNFRTACESITTLPFSENFNSYGTGTSIYVPCWSKLYTSTVDRPYISTTNYSAPGGLYFYKDLANSYNIAVTPPFDASIPVNSLMATFWYRNTNSTDRLMVGVMTDPTDASTFDTITIIAAPTTATWAEYEVNFSAYTGSGQYIAFKNYSDESNAAYGYVDDLIIDIIPSCARPSDLAVSNITTTDVDISWTPASTGDIGWNLLYKESTVTDYDTVYVTSSPYTLSGLMPNTVYNFMMQNDCQDGTFSNTTNVYTFRTACEALTLADLPYSESFDTYGTGTATFYSFIPCWNKLTTYNERPYLNATNHSAPASLYFYTTGAGTYNIVAAPPFDASVPVNTLRISFWYRTYYAADRLIIGVMDDPTDATTFTSVDTVTAPSTATWVQREVPLATYTGTGQYIAFKNEYYASSTGYAYIDDLVIDTLPSCPDVYSFGVGLGSNASANITWDTSIGSDFGWILAYDEVDAATFEPTTATNQITLSASDFPYNVSGLTVGSTYTFAMQTVCGSNWTAPVTLTIPVTVTVPYTQNFEDLTNVAEWNFVSPTSTGGTSTDGWYIGSATGNTGNSMYVSSDGGTTNNYSVMSTTSVAYAYVDFGQYNEYQLSFDWKGVGEPCCDKFCVYAVPVDYNFVYFGYSTPPTGQEIRQIVAPINQQSAWQHIDVTLSGQNYSNTIQKLAFIWLSDGSSITNPPAAVDNISIIELNCVAPTNLIASNVTTTTADIAWTDNTATQWTIQYMLADSTDWTTANEETNITSNTYTLTNLNHSETYKVRVKAVCGVGDESNWTSPVQFTTACAIITELPWTENFTGLTTGSGQFPQCWSRYNNATITTTNPYINASNNGGASSTAVPNSPSGSPYMYFSNSTSLTAITPMFDMDINTLRVKFWLSREGASSGTFSVGYYTDLTDLTSFTAVETFDDPDDIWTYHEVVFSSVPSGVNHIAFRQNQLSTSWYYWLDDIEVSEIPNCVRPTALTASNITTTSAEISWTNGNENDASWLFLYKKESDIDYDTLYANTNPYSLNGLEHSTIYNVILITDCGSNTYSENSNVFSFATNCEAVTEFPWYEGFENDWINATGVGDKPAPLCWTTIDRGGTNGTYQYWWKRATGTTSHSGNGHAVCYTDYGTSSHNDWLITPQMALTGNERLRFWAMRSSTTTAEPDEISIFISNEDVVLDTTGMGTNDTLQGFTRIFQQNLPVGNWERYEINLNQYSGNRYIAFVRQGTPDGYNLRLDDVEISPLPVCMTPTNVSLTYLTSDSATISWINGTENDDNWLLLYKESDSVEYDTLYISENPYSLENLTPATTYNVIIVTDCGTDGYSEASSMITFTTPCISIPTISLPYTENFDSYAAGSGSFPICWARYNGGVPITTNPYITNAQSHSASNSIYFSSSNSMTIVSPNFEADINTLRVNFWLRREGASSGTFSVGYYANPTDLTSFVAIQTYDDANATWINHECTLSSASNGIKNVAFRQNQVSSSWYYLLDDVVISEIPSCPDVYNFNAVLIDSNNSVQISWDTSVGAENGWIIAYDETTSALFDPDAANQISVSATDFPYIIEGLNEGSVYTFAMQSDCGGNWTNYIQLGIPTTITIPYLQDFETVSTEWMFSSNTADKWYIGSATGNTGNSMYISDDGGVSNHYNSANTYAYAKAKVEFGSDSQYQLSFDWKCMGESYLNHVNMYDYARLYLLSVDSPMPQHTVLPTGGTILVDSMWYSNTWQSDTITISGYSDTSMLLVFMFRTDGSGQGSASYQPPIAIDNLSISVYNVTACDPVTNLAVSGTPTQTSATITWMASATATQYEVKLGATGTVSIESGTTFSFNSLTANTPYTAYVRSDCGGGNYSSWVSVPFTTAAYPPCDDPTNVVATTVNQTDATITWTAGTATAWNVRIDGGT